MKKVRFAFYIAKFDLINVIRGKRKPHLIDDGISLWTGLFNWWTPGYSHSEVWIQSLFFPSHNPDEAITVFEISDLPGTHFGFCYTSTMRGDHNGTVKRAAQDVFTHPERWEYIELEVTDESFEEATAWADYRVKLHMSYALGDLLRFAMPLWLLKKLHLDDPEREICSEHGEGWAVKLKRGVWVKRPILIEEPVLMSTIYLLLNILIRSPRRLWRDLVRRHHVPTYSLSTGQMVRDNRGKKVKA